MIFNKEQERVLWQVGSYLAEKGLPLGFLNSERFNPSFKAEGRVSMLLERLRQTALKELPYEIGSSKAFSDLKFALWLLSNTYAYVVTSPYHSKDLQGFNLGQQEVRLGSLNLTLLEQAVSVSDRQKSSLKKIYEGFGDSLNSGLLPFPSISLSKDKLTFPRKQVSFLDSEYMVLPVSVVNGYVSTLKERSKEGIITIDAHRVGGALREFNLTSKSRIALELYTDTLLLEDFETVGFELTPVITYQESKLKLMKGLSRLLLTFYDLGIAESEYPQRQLSLSRIEKITYLSPEEEEAKLRQLKRYSLMSETDMVRQINHLAKSWSSEEQAAFLVDSLARLKRLSGIDTSVSSYTVGSIIEFQLRFSECIEYYSTAYLRVVYDMIQEESERFNFITGRKAEVEVVSPVVSESFEIPSELDFG